MIAERPGYPAIPVIRLNLSRGSEISYFKIIETDTILLSLPLVPIGEYIEKKSELQNIYIPDKELYIEDRMLIRTDYNEYTMGKGKIVELFPFNYNPSENMLIVNKIEIHYSSTPALPGINDNNIVIIYNEQFSDIYDETESFFIRRGKIPYMYSMTQTGRTADSIGIFIDSIFSEKPFSYLLLMGSSSMLPGNWGLGDGNPYTDLSYALIDTLDYLPDIILSRLPFDSSAQFLHYYNKMEQSMNANALTMRDNAYFMASNDYGYHTLAESTQIYSMEKFRAIDYETDSLFYYYNTGTPVDEAIDEGRALLFYTGHGLTYEWNGPSFDRDDIDSLKNAPFYPFIFSFACLTGNYYYGGFFGNHWLKLEDKGAIGFMGSSKETFWEQDDLFQRFMVDSLVQGDYIFNAVNKGKINFFNYYGNSSVTRRYFEQYNYFAVPDIYVGNTDVSNISISVDRYIPLSSGNIDCTIGYDGILGEPGFLVVCGDSLIDSSRISAQGEYILNHSILLSDTLALSLYIPGQQLFKEDIVLIDNGPFVALKDQFISDIKTDTLFIDMDIKNYGNNTAYNISSYMKHLPIYMTVLNNSIYIDSMLPESIESIGDALVLLTGDNSGSGADTLCTLGFVFDYDTVFSVFSVADLAPSFDAVFIEAICTNDTSSSITLGIATDIFFQVRNTSKIKAKNISITIDGEFNTVYSSGECDSLLSMQTFNPAFGIIVEDSEDDEVIINMTVSMGSYSEGKIFRIPLKLKNSYSFIGPMSGYYIYTSDMIDLENRPEFKDIRSDSSGWSLIDVRDDETVSLSLPFTFKTGDDSFDILYLNANGIISTDSIESSLFGVTALPNSGITGKAFIFGWHDFRFPELTYISDYLGDLRGSALYKINALNTEFQILYNRVTDYNNDTFTFSVCIDTTNILINFYEIPYDNNLVNGIQFSNSEYISFTGDSFSDVQGNPLIRDSFAMIFTRDLPVMMTKFSNEKYTGTHAPILMSGIMYRQSTSFIIGVFEPGIYEIRLYDIAGRLQSELYSGFLNRGNIVLPNTAETDGIYFITMSGNKGTVLSRKIIILGEH